MKIEGLEGRECGRIEPLIQMMVDGEADAAQTEDARLQLETCLTCRVTMRDYSTTADLRTQRRGKRRPASDALRLGLLIQKYTLPS